MAAGVERLGPRLWRLRDRDGRAHVLRPMRPADAPALQRAFAAQEPQDRAMRTLSVMAALPDRMALRFCTVDETRDLALAIFPEDDPALLVGGARLMRDRDGESAEYAVSVASALKGHGFGRRALETALEAGREMGVRRVWGLVARENHAMRGLAAKLGFSEEPDPDDAALVITRLTL